MIGVGVGIGVLVGMGVSVVVSVSVAVAVCVRVGVSVQLAAVAFLASWVWKASSSLEGPQAVRMNSRNRLGTTIRFIKSLPDDFFNYTELSLDSVTKYL